ncbi:MAG: hypothetical protein WC479_03525 [Candidatus Izemoplasmatales bacterium]
MFKLQFYYLMNRTSIGFLATAMTLLTGALLYSSRFYESATLLDANRALYQAEYLSESIGIIKFVIIISSLFLNLHCFLGVNGKYSAFFVTKQADRRRFILAKLAMINLIVFVMSCSAWCIYNLIGTYLTPYHVITLGETRLFGYITIEAVILGLIEAILMQVFDSLFSGLIPLMGFWGLEVFGIDEILIDSKPVSILYQIIPHLVHKDVDFIVYGTWCGYVLFLVSLLLLNIIIFQNRDIS